MSYATLRYAVADTGVATIAMDQPDTRNALSDELLSDLIAAFEAARDDDAVRCVVLTSTHPTTFSAGGNLGGFAADVPLAHKHCGHRALPAAVHADRRAGQARAVRRQRPLPGRGARARARVRPDRRADGRTFGTPEINVGVFPFMIMALIYRNLGRKKTTERLLLGERIDAREAERIGIVNRVVAPEDFDAAVDEWAGRLAKKSPLLMRMGKDAMYRQQDMAFEDALGFLRAQLAIASRPRTSRRA